MCECLINELMIMHNGTIPLSLQPDELYLLQTALYSLSVRSENIFILPLLQNFSFTHPSSFSPFYYSLSTHFFLFSTNYSSNLNHFPFFPPSLSAPPFTTINQYIFIVRYEISFKELIHAEWVRKNSSQRG